MISKIKSYGLLILAVVIALQLVYIKLQERGRQKDLQVITELDQSLNRVLTIKNNQVVDKYRDSKGTVIVKTKYVPQEGKVTVSVPKDPSKPVVVKVKNKGLCFTTGIAVTAYSRIARSKLGNEIVPVVFFSPKLAYWGRYGLIANINHKSAGFGVSRHLDDIPLWHPSNLEVYVSYHPFQFADTLLIGYQRWFVGARITL